MKNEKLVQKWLEFADMDFSLAQFTFSNMYPKPLELICYHCQQAAEKALKALLIANGEQNAPKTHDLALLADSLGEQFALDSLVYDSCADLTPYGVKVRYPEEVRVDEPMTEKALSDARRIMAWAKTEIEKL